MNSLFVIHTCETVCFLVLCNGNARFKIFKLLLGWTFYLNRFNRRNYFCVKSMSMFTILIKLTLRKRKFFDMIYCFCIFACDVLQLPFVGSALFLNRLVKDFRASFFFFFVFFFFFLFFFFFDWCSRGMWTVPGMLHWTVRKKSGYRFYYFLRMGVTYHVDCRKTAGTDIKSHWTSHDTGL